MCEQAAWWRRRAVRPGWRALLVACAVAAAVLLFADPALAGTITGSGGHAAAGKAGGSPEQVGNNVLDLVVSVGGIVLMVLFVVWMLVAAGRKDFRQAAEALALFLLAGVAVFAPHEAKALVQSIVDRVTSGIG